MSGAFQYVDIIIFGSIAVFLIAKLVSVLGKKTGNEQDAARRRPQSFQVRRGAQAEKSGKGGDNVIALPDRELAQPVVTQNAQAAEGLEQIAAADPSFDPRAFLRGARSAFEMIVAAFAKGDSESLKQLLSPAVFADFDSAIAARKAEGQSQDNTLIGLKSSDITAAALVGSESQITVCFKSEQVNVTKDGEGRVVDGDPNQIAEVTDIWTFSRALDSRDPNWLVSATSSPDT